MAEVSQIFPVKYITTELPDDGVVPAFAGLSYDSSGQVTGVLTAPRTVTAGDFIAVFDIASDPNTVRIYEIQEFGGEILDETLATGDMVLALAEDLSEQAGNLLACLGPGRYTVVGSAAIEQTFPVLSAGLDARITALEGS